jgi:uncharacterized phage protein (predicted DNA packaging)
MIVSLEEAKNWARIDDGDESTVALLIDAAEIYLKNATGKQFDSTNNQAKLFCLVLVTDWYENRELMGVKVSEKVRFSIQSILAQLRYGGDGTSESSE